MSISKRYVIKIIVLTILAPIGLLAFQKKNSTPHPLELKPDTIVKIVYDTIYKEKIVYDTIISYVDTNSLIISKRKSFLYIKDTFNIEDRTYYITEKGDTVKTFYYDYTYYIFKYHFKDTIVSVDSVIGCDIFTHHICSEQKRVVMFHYCEGESRMIINTLIEQGK